MPFIITNPPTKRRRRIDGTFLLIPEDKTWEKGVEVFCFTQTGCVQNPGNNTYQMDDGAQITVVSGIIDQIEE